MHLSDGQEGAGGILGRGQCMDRIPGPALAPHMQGNTGSSGLQGQEGGWTGRGLGPNIRVPWVPQILEGF